MGKSPGKIILDANSVLAVGNNKTLVHDFLDSFSQCEVYCRPFLVQYHKSNGSFKSVEDIGLDLQDIKYAFSEKGVYFSDDKLLTRIFGKEDSPGKSSCRWLRNKITHELMKRAISEVCNRNIDLIGDMNTFISEVEAQS